MLSFAGSSELKRNGWGRVAAKRTKSVQSELLNLHTISKFAKLFSRSFVRFSSPPACLCTTHPPAYPLVRSLSTYRVPLSLFTGMRMLFRHFTARIDDGGKASTFLVFCRD